MATNGSIRALTQRAERLESARRRERMAAKVMTDKLVGNLAAGTSAAVAGYLDGRFDVTRFDDEPGDGLQVLGLPAMLVLAVGSYAGGMYVGGKVGAAMQNSGVGVACGLAYGRMLRAGQEAAEKAGE